MNNKYINKINENLKPYGLEFSDLANFRYVGGNENSHLNYYKMEYNGKYPNIPQSEECICGHQIKENCYITNDKIFVVIGNCCIKKFIPKDKQGRTCKMCRKSHRNRKNNYCNECRIKHGDFIKNEKEVNRGIWRGGAYRNKPTHINKIVCENPQYVNHIFKNKKLYGKSAIKLAMMYKKHVIEVSRYKTNYKKVLTQIKYSNVPRSNKWFKMSLNEVSKIMNIILI